MVQNGQSLSARPFGDMWAKFRALSCFRLCSPCRRPSTVGPDVKANAAPSCDVRQDVSTSSVRTSTRASDCSTTHKAGITVPHSQKTIDNETHEAEADDHVPSLWPGMGCTVPGRPHAWNAKFSPVMLQDASQHDPNLRAVNITCPHCDKSFPYMLPVAANAAHSAGAALRSCWC